MNRHAGLSVNHVSRLNHVVLHVAANAVLRTEQRNQFNVRMLVEQIGCMAKIMIDRGLIAYQTDAGAAQQIYLFSEQPFDSSSDRLRVYRSALALNRRASNHR